MISLDVISGLKVAWEILKKVGIFIKKYGWVLFIVLVVVIVLVLLFRKPGTGPVQVIQVPVAKPTTDYVEMYREEKKRHEEDLVQPTAVDPAHPQFDVRKLQHFVDKTSGKRAGSAATGGGNGGQQPAADSIR